MIESKVRFLKSKKCSQGKVKKKILRENKKKQGGRTLSTE